MITKEDDEKLAGLDLENVSFRGLELTVVPSVIFSMGNILRLELSSNSLTRFPGARVAQELQCLEVLVLCNNLLHVLEDILALAAAPRLCELDLRDNPLRLNHNRLYLLEALLFHEAKFDEELLSLLHQDKGLKNFRSDLPTSRNMIYRSRLPRRRAYPMLQRLNGDWILDVESRQAELEQGKAIQYFRPASRGNNGKIGARRKVESAGRNERRFDGSRMTLRNEARITAIPLPKVVAHYQIDMESCKEVHDELNTTHELPPPDPADSTEKEPSCELDSNSSSDEEDNERKLWQQLLRPIASQSQELHSSNNSEQQQKSTLDIKTSNVDNEQEPWNYPISTFDDLHSDERQYVRYKSKHVSGSFERDDHFFESTTFVDCVAQCERSRRLTIRAVDLLTQPQIEAATTLTNNLSTNFTKDHARESYERLTDFQQKQVTVGGIDIQAEESLSKVKLRNAVDLANSLAGSKQQKRLLQALIDADAKVIEEERVMEEYKGHRQRLSRINARQVVQPQSRRGNDHMKKLATLHLDSPWQARNWKAKVVLQQRKEQEETANAQQNPTLLSRSGKKMQPHRSDTNPNTIPGSTSATSSESSKRPNEILVAAQVGDKFRNIETVEKAALDPLTAVNSHDLLVRCSEIRQNKDKHVRALNLHRDRFLDDEAEWEEMRQNQINVVRRHLRRKLYQDVQQIQIGGMEYVYSPLFLPSADENPLH
ncbi:hypothetical protein BBJ29_000912 [Phytophthora kernoviae]|uniref:Uncharacterized protein n=1 Tax=Phytophthora kernoviae TaxID=325452 RepID=A0A3F2RXR5_9STRA|nr:hypothetical protein BBJ29_000912 [Phytophthora kernoviae]RLN65398.1 hypothetical protein BBP00_00002863 [Phytophthora kernoviae]